MHLLDANVCIGLMNGTLPRTARSLAEHAPSEVRLCAVVKAELLYGARKSTDPAGNLRRLEQFFAAFGSFPFDDAAAVCYGGIREGLERSGTPIGPNDLMIAAIAMANDAILITRNTREFERVIGLKIEDWERDPDPLPTAKPAR